MRKIYKKVVIFIKKYWPEIILFLGLSIGTFLIYYSQNNTGGNI